MFGRLATVVVAAVLLTASAVISAEKTPARVFGKGVTDPADTVPISQLLSNPDKYLDKTVRVSGVVVGVCEKRGCWMDLASDQEFQTLQIKVNDGEIVFPMDLMGETAVAEGVFTGIPMTLEQTCSYLESEAKCQGKEFDRASVKGPTTFYRLNGLGAVVTPTEKKDAVEAPAKGNS